MSESQSTMEAAKAWWKISAMLDGFEPLFIYDRHNSDVVRAALFCALRAGYQRIVSEMPASKESHQ